MSVVDDAALDFETTTSYSVDVSVFDGYRRSLPASVTINVTNENDNTPVIATPQSFRIDGGVRNVVGKAVAGDADDTNQPNFTTLQNWQLTGGGTGAALFAIQPASGAIRVAKPMSIDFRRSSYDPSKSLLTRKVFGTVDDLLRPRRTTRRPFRCDFCVWYD